MFPNLKRVRFRFKYGMGNPRLYKCLAWSAPGLRSMQINQIAFHGIETLRANLASSFGISSGSGIETLDESERATEAQVPRWVSPRIILELMHEPTHPMQQLAWNAEYTWLKEYEKENPMFTVVQKGVVPQYENVVLEWANGYWV